MAQIEWPRPWGGKEIRKRTRVFQIPPDPCQPRASGTTELKHSTTEIGEHIGAARLEASPISVVASRHVYVSWYPFQIKPDDASDSGPWQVTSDFNIMCGVFAGISKRADQGNVEVTATAQIRRLSDQKVVFTKQLQDLLLLGNHPSRISKSSSDLLMLGPEEHELRIVTWMELSLTANKRFPWRRGRSWLEIYSGEITDIKLKIT